MNAHKAPYLINNSINVRRINQILVAKMVNSIILNKKNVNAQKLLHIGMIKNVWDVNPHNILMNKQNNVQFVLNQVSII